MRGWRIRGPAVAICAALAACGPGAERPEAERPEAERPGAEQPDAAPAARLEAVIREYVAARRADDERDALRDVSAEAFRGKLGRQQSMLDELRVLPEGGLSLDQDIDRRLLIGLLESDVRSARHRAAWENDPALYLPSARIGLALEPAAAGAPEARARRATALLGALPERLAHGRANLARPPQRFTEAAIFQAEGTLKTLRERAPPLARQAGAAGDELLAASRSADAALDSYLGFLKTELLPRSDGSWAIGKEEYDFILRHRWFMQDDAEAILERGRRAFAETQALAQQVAGRIDPGRHWSEVYEALKDDRPAADEIKAAYQSAMDAARAFVRERRIVTLPEGERVVTVDTPPAMRRSSPFGTFESVDPFGDGLEGRLVLTPIEDWMTPEQRAERLRSHHRAWIPVIAVHEAYPGHHAHALKIRENPRPLRRVVRESIFSEGWGLYTEELMYELGFLEGDAVRLTQLRNRLWRAARVILDVSLHTERMSIGEAVDFLVENVRFERYAAELEVGMYPRRPTYVLGYLIGMQEIGKIRDDYVAAHGEPSPPSEFYDRLLRVGAIPPALARRALLDGASPDAGSSRRAGAGEKSSRTGESI